MKELDLALGYAVTLGTATEDLLELAGTIITDTNLARCYPRLATRALVVPAGEQSKSPQQYIDLARGLVEMGTRRSDTLIALGGGVVGDLAGFAAATLYRGVDLVHVPTSLLAMVDSSIGGKVGIDLPEGKNLLGSFHNPTAVHVRTQFLETLPAEEFANGCAEIIKYGWIADAELIDRLHRPLGATSPHLQHIIERCVAIKAEVVRSDPFERTGRRAILNFGHTVGHALESAANYQGIRHGEAVAIGMVAEIEIGRVLGVTPFDSSELASMIAAHNLPTRPAQPVVLDSVLEFMVRDKKNAGAGFAMSLLTGRGECKLVNRIEPRLVAQTLKQIWSC